MNRLGKKGEAFFFLFDFELEKLIVIPSQELKQQQLWFDINGKRNFRTRKTNIPKVAFQKEPISQEKYKVAFDYVQREILAGNSYLVNLTFPTAIQLNTSLKDIFLHSQAKYKLLLDNQTVFFSPETFVQIYDGKIASFPMKGTIDADLPNAAERILADKKEQAEHATIVDLIRNDLNIVSNKVAVERYRFLSKIKSNQKNLLHVSSKITGVLPINYQETIGDILLALLPAGSISGAPKKMTVEIIQNAEEQKRGYYTGIMGYFDGKNLDSGVAIRYIVQQKEQFWFRSGGGITASSDSYKEYQELIDKVYVPIY